MSSRRRFTASETRIKYTQLNSDVFTSIVNFGWREVVEEYKRAKQVEGLKEASIYEALLTLDHFERLLGPDSSRGITQNTLDQFILDRGREVSRNTLNKDIRKIRKAVGLPNLKFHDLRKTFASLLAQRGVSTAVTQRLLEHSSPQLTNDVYTNIDPVLRQAIDLLPVSEWL